MTDISKSDAQLDAEAAGRPAYDLTAAIALHRALWLDDCRIPRLVSRQPPTDKDALNTSPPRPKDDVPRQHPGTGVQVGMPASGMIVRRVFDARPGEMFPWVTAFRALRHHCRKEHRASHTGYDRPYWRGSLCQEAVRLTVIGKERAHGRPGPLSAEEAASVLRLPDLDGVLPGAFRWLEDNIDWQRDRAEQRAKLDGGVFSVGERIVVTEHHAVGGLHALECEHPECRPRRAA